MADNDCEPLLNEDGGMSLRRGDDNYIGCCIRCIRKFAWCCLKIVFYNRYVRCVVNFWTKYDPEPNRNDRNNARNKLVPFRCDCWRKVLKSMACILCPFVCCSLLYLKFRKKRHSEKSQHSCDEVRISIDDESRLNETQKQLQDEKEENARLHSLLESMEFDLKESKESNNEQKKQLNEQQQKTNDLRSRLEQTSKQLEVEKTEKEKALTRLSAVAGDKLRLNNPGIADLSDENRPNKLAEKFSELYDNEWTELYDDLESGGKAEPDIVEEMLNLLQNIYQHASEMAEKQRRTLVTVISKPSTTELDQFENPSDQILSKVIELQKQTGSMSIGNLKQIIAVKVHAQEMSEVKKKYYDRCVQLCWIMAIQDPPMMLDFGKGKGMPVNTDVFRMFTKQGTTTDFVVWPAIYLHENGPLVQKGVLQPD